MFILLFLLFFFFLLRIVRFFRKNFDGFDQISNKNSKIIKALSNPTNEIEPDNIVVNKVDDSRISRCLVQVQC